LQAPLRFLPYRHFLLRFRLAIFFHLPFLRFFLIQALKADLRFPLHFLAARFILAHTRFCAADAIITSPS